MPVIPKSKPAKNAPVSSTAPETEVADVTVEEQAAADEKLQAALAEIAAENNEKARIQREANEAAKKAFGKPVEIVDLDEQIQSESLPPEQQRAGVKFWFGEIGVITFPDKSTYHIHSKTAFITDPALIGKLKEYAARVPTQKIFIQ